MSLQCFRPVQGNSRIAIMVPLQFVSETSDQVNEMNIREIAERARVSVATVSRVVNHVPTVNRKLAKRVRKVVAELGYSANSQARGLASGKSRTLGLVVSCIADPFFTEIIQSFENAAVRRGYEVLVASTFHDFNGIELCVRRMVERRIEGAAILTFGWGELIAENLRAQGIVAVSVNGGPRGSKASAVWIDYGRGIRQALEHLAALGHERIAHVIGPLHSTSALTKRSEFEKYVSEIGISVSSELIVTGDDTVEGGMSAFAQLAQLRDQPTAIFCSNDMTAVGVIRQAHELGVAVPQELSVIGCDDISFARAITPPLTTVRVPQAELARLAFRALLGELDRTKGKEPREYVLETDFVLRRSTALVSSSNPRPTDLRFLEVEPCRESRRVERARRERMTVAGP